MERPDGADVAPDVRLELTHGPGGPGVLADGRALAVPPHASATDVGLAAARRHAARSGRDLLVEVVDGASVTRVSVGPQGFVTLVSAPPRPAAAPGPAAAPTEWAAEPRTEVPLRPAPELPPRATTPPVGGPSPWARPAPAPATTGRPVASLVATALVAVAVLVGAVGTGVATLASSQALPGSCRPVTVYAVGGTGGASDVLRGVTDPLTSQFGEKLSVVTVPAPPTGGSYASAEADAVSSLATAVGEHVDGCPTGALMLFGYSQGAQVAGDLASRVGTGLEPRIPAELVSAVGLFGDPARSPRTRAVPEGTTGQGALPARAVGFGSLDARTIEICAPGDPVCDSPPDAAAPALEQAIASPVHGSYQQLPVAAGTTAPQWAAGSLGKVVAAIPTDAGPAKAPAGTTAQSGGVAAPSTSAGTGAAPETSGPASETSDPGSGQPDGPATGGATPGDVTPGDVASGPTGTTAPGTGTTGSAEGGAGAATRRSGASSTVAPDGGSASGTASSDSTGASGTGTDDQGSAGTGYGETGSDDAGSADTGSPTTGPTGTGSTGTGSSGTVTGGQGSGGAGSTEATGTGGAGPTATRAPGSTTGSGSGSGSGTGSGTTGSGEYGTDGSSVPSTAESTTPGATPSASGRSTTTSTGATPSRGEATGAVTGAAFSLVSGLEGFKSTPWNNQNATDPSAAPSPNVPGREAVKFEMPGGGKRTEAEPDVPEFQQGQKSFVGYSGFFAPGFPTNTDTWQLIMQFKQPGTGSPPLAVEVGKNQLRLANDGGNEKDFCPVTDGAPFSFQLGITFGGAVDAWCNGTQTLSGYTTPQSNVQGSAYLKTGIYRDESIQQDSTLFLNDLKVGKTLEQVSGLAGASGGSATGAAGATTTDTGRATTTGTGAAATTTEAAPSTGTGSGAAVATPASAAPTGTGTSAGSATADTATTGQKVCDKFGSTDVDGGRFLVQDNEWGASDGQCVTATRQGFTVDSGNHAKNDAPAAYPSIMSGCWMGTCTQGTTLPTRISDLGPITSSITGSIPAGTTSNLAYDVWADSTPRRTGHNDAMELMIWLQATGGIRPIGQQSGTATVGGTTWDVWKGTNGGVNVISYVRRTPVDRADDLPISDFVKDAVTQGSVQATDFVTNIQAGFEPWTGGPGMALSRFTVDYGAPSPAR